MEAVIAPRPKPDPRRRTTALDERIGRNIRFVRILRSLSQAALGEALGVTFQQVQKYEAGANRVSHAMLVRIADVLEHPIERFAAEDVMAGNAARETAPLPRFEPRDYALLEAIQKLSADQRRSITDLVAALTPAGRA